MLLLIQDNGIIPTIIQKGKWYSADHCCEDRNLNLDSVDHLEEKSNSKVSTVVAFRVVTVLYRQKHRRYWCLLLFLRVFNYHRKASFLFHIHSYYERKSSNIHCLLHLNHSRMWGPRQHQWFTLYAHNIPARPTVLKLVPVWRGKHGTPLTFSWNTMNRSE